ncbi:MAG: NAD-dependent epimerase/dehydratase family protein [Bacteroidales bacterium]|nr:NAD-dependent epimerase/dehydratase family protein [Bacteroidales bacterium]
MKILVTGAKGFVGKNLCAQLKNIRDGKARNYGIAGRAGNDEDGHARPDRASLYIEEIFEYDLDSTPEQLDAWCASCDFVFNLAGVNRPQNASEFMEGNFGFASTLLDTLRKHGNHCPVMLSSSQQASLTGRFGNSEYGRSKKAGEDLFLKYGEEIAGQAGNDGRSPGLRDEPNPGLRPRVLVYRFPNLFGKWCRPNYNSAVATFCNAIANDLPYTVNDPSVELELLYIDDLVDEMIACLRGEEHRCEFDGLGVFPMKDGRYCYVPTTHHATLGEIVDLLNQFATQPQTLLIPEIPAGSFAKKLYSTYLSYLPKEKVAFPLKMNVDNRGSFTELVHTLNAGQVSINISKPGITKGQHWHNTKWEFFIVVAGHGLIQERKLGTDEVIEFEVSGDNIQCVHMLPGYTHNIINLSDTENLVTVMYCNEIFDPNKPDTYFELVK